MATSHAGGKSAAAFRTISEVSGDLEVPQHVLRFWETKFSQVRPLKRAGGRRYYRPEDVALLRKIRDLLYAEGYTIKGVQRLLRNGNGPAEEEALSDTAADGGRGAALAPGQRRELEAILGELRAIKRLLKDER